MKRYNAFAALAAVIMTVTCAGCESGSAVASVTTKTTAVTEVSSPAQTVTSAQSVNTGVSGYTPRSELLQCLYYDDLQFCENEERSVIYETDGVPVCGVAPHHLTAGHMIAGMYRTAAENRGKTDTVVLIAPMHYDEENTLITSKKSWDTAFGTAGCDTETAELFIDRLGAKEDDDMVQYDHSASSHIPFIKRNFPDAEIACLLVSPKELPDIAAKLPKLLYEIARTKDCFFAFSIDFSHYLDPDEADEHDKKTLEAVLSGNTDKILRFTNSNVDTPYCLCTFVRLSELLGVQIKKADNSNTLRISNLPYSRTFFPEGVTSYFVFFS